MIHVRTKARKNTKDFRVVIKEDLKNSDKYAEAYLITHNALADPRWIANIAAAVSKSLNPPAENLN